MPCGRWLRKYVTIWARRSAAIWAQCSRPGSYKLSGTGRQGDLMGGGITGGYQLRLSDALSLDFNVAVGCLHADYEKYEVIDGVRVRAGKETKNWWGPVNAGVTLVWKLF